MQLLFLSDFSETRFFFDRFQKNTQIYNFVTICPVEAELFHADGLIQDGKDEVTSRSFAQFCAIACSRTSVCILTDSIYIYIYIIFMPLLIVEYTNSDSNYTCVTFCSHLESTIQCFSNTVAHGHVVALQNNHGSSHLNTDCPDDRCPKLQIYISEPTFDSYQYIPVALVTTHCVTGPPLK